MHAPAVTRRQVRNKRPHGPTRLRAEKAAQRWIDDTVAMFTLIEITPRAYVVFDRAVICSLHRHRRAGACS